MPNKNRARGDYFERRTREALEAAGWFVVRSAGSFGPADLVAIRVGHSPLLISCKLTGKITRADALALHGVAVRAGAHAILAWRDRPGSVVLEECSEHGRVPLYSLRMPALPPKPKKPPKETPDDPDQLTIYDALQ